MKTKHLRKLLGWKGVYIGVCRSLHWAPVPVKLPIFGRCSTIAEAQNIYDNFGLLEIRDEVIEREIQNHPTPVIVDCGVNVGTTIRWWFHLNPGARVLGMEMMQESQDFTQAALRMLETESGKKLDYTPKTCALSGKEGQEIVVNFNHALEGTNSLNSGAKAQQRKFVTKTLDSELDSAREILVLKLDLEGVSHDVLKGGTKTLAKVKHVIFETHSEEETVGASDALFRAGFKLRRISNRTGWWVRQPAASG